MLVQMQTLQQCLVLILVFLSGALIGYGFVSSPDSQRLIRHESCPEVEVIRVSSPPCSSLTTTLADKDDSNNRNDDDDTSAGKKKFSASSSSSCELPFLQHDSRFASILNIGNGNSAPPSILSDSFRVKSVSSSSNSKNGYNRSQRSFKEIGDSMKDDKTLLHRFDIPYTLMLEHARATTEPFSIFEIGLGCDQHLGAGASVALWGEYLPRARLAVLELEGVCARDWNTNPDKRARAPSGGFVVYQGDQGSEDDWVRVLMLEKGQMYDLIIDDGSHKNSHIVDTFMRLWPMLKRGGVYVIEDMNTAFKTRYGGSKRPTPSAATSVNLVSTLMMRLHALPVHRHKQKYDEDIQFKSQIASVSCWHFICAISKR